MNMGGRHLSSSRLKSCNSNLLGNSVEKRKKINGNGRTGMTHFQFLDGKNTNVRPNASKDYCTMPGGFGTR